MNGKSDDAGESDALFLQCILDLNHGFLLSLQLNPGTQGVDVGNEAGCFLIFGKLVEGFGGLQFRLRRFEARLLRDDEQVVGADGQHDGVASIAITELGGFHLLRRKNDSGQSKRR